MRHILHVLYLRVTFNFSSSVFSSEFRKSSGSPPVEAKSGSSERTRGLPDPGGKGGRPSRVGSEEREPAGSTVPGAAYPNAHFPPLHPKEPRQGLSRLRQLLLSSSGRPRGGKAMFSSTQASLHLKTAFTPGQCPPRDSVHPGTVSTPGQAPAWDSVQPGTVSTLGWRPPRDRLQPGMASTPGWHGLPSPLCPFWVDGTSGRQNPPGSPDWAVPPPHPSCQHCCNGWPPTWPVLLAWRPGYTSPSD